MIAAGIAADWWSGWLDLSGVEGGYSRWMDLDIPSHIF